MDKPTKKLTSFKRLPKVPEPAKPTLSQNIGIPGLMRPGTVLTEIEKEGLKKLGIVDDPTKLPSDIASKIHSAMVDAEKQPVELPSVKPLQMPETVDFDDLPEEKKRSIAQFIKEAAEERKKQSDKPVTKSDPPLDPKIFKQPEVIDDLIDDKPNKEPVNKPVEEPKLPDDDSDLLAKNSIVVCPHCGWDTRKEDLVNITEDDKLDFVQSILGGIRFKKVYELFGGRLKVTFRALTSAESDTAYKQLIIDAQNDVQSKIIGDSSFYWRTLMAYRSVMGVEKIESDVNIIEVPPVLEIEVDEEDYPKPNTKIYALFDKLVEQIMPTEMMRSTITHVYTEFQTLCEKLQTMSESPDFWKATK
jgi:hypothetical protein